MIGKEHNNYSQISIQNDINLKDIIEKIGVIIFKRKDEEKIYEIIGKKIKIDKKISLVQYKDKHWILFLLEGIIEEQISTFQRLIGLTATIICLDLPLQIQGIIEKIYCKVINQTLLSNSISNRLVFINDIYKNKSQTLQIKFCENIQKALTVINNEQTLKTPSIKVIDLIEIFQCEKIENIPKVRLLFQKYQDICHRQLNFQAVKKIVFSNEHSKNLVQKQIKELQVSQQTRNKLLWKNQQFNKWKDWLVEQTSNNQFQCGHFTFKDIKFDISYVVMVRYKQIWIKNSLLQLKKIFIKIKNSTDKLYIDEFANLYRQMKEKLCFMKKFYARVGQNDLLQEMEDKLDHFYQYHQAFIKNQVFSSLKFAKEELLYIWKYNNNVYKKLTTFLIIASLGLIQKNYLNSLTLIALAFLTLALRF